MDIFDVDDRIVDDFAQRDHQPGEDHRVQRRAEGRERENRRDERERNRERADERGPRIEQEDAEDEDDENATDEQRMREIIDSAVDERGRAENGRVDLDAGEAGFQIFECGVDFRRHIAGVGVGLFFDDQQEAGAAVDDRIADRRRVTEADVGDGSEPRRRVADEGDGGSREVGRLADVGPVPHGEPLIGLVDVAAGIDGGRVLGRFQNLVERDAGGVQMFGVHEDLVLFVPLAPYGDVGDTGDSHQARADRPEGEHGEVLLVQRVRRNADFHNAGKRRQRLQNHGGAGDDRQTDRFRGDAFLNVLPGFVNVGPLFEEKHDGR